VTYVEKQLQDGTRISTKKTRVVDPDPDWIRIQRLCGSGSVLGFRIQGQENLRNFSGKNALFSYLKKNFTTKKV
jgi:hypothetical protein